MLGLCTPARIGSKTKCKRRGADTKKETREQQGAYFANSGTSSSQGIMTFIQTAKLHPISLLTLSLLTLLDSNFPGNPLWT